MEPARSLCAHIHLNIHTICRQGSAPDSLSGEEFTGPWTSEMLHGVIALRGLTHFRPGMAFLRKEFLRKGKLPHHCTAPKIVYDFCRVWWTYSTSSGCSSSVPSTGVREHSSFISGIGARESNCVKPAGLWSLIHSDPELKNNQCCENGTRAWLQPLRSGSELRPSCPESCRCKSLPVPQIWFWSTRVWGFSQRKPNWEKKPISVSAIWVFCGPHKCLANIFPCEWKEEVGILLC